MITYRAAVPADEPEIHAIWSAAFATPRLVPLYETDDDRLGRTFVAVGAEGVESVVYWMPRRLRSAGGGSGLVGCVANVATSPAARGRGHIRRLLAMAVESMTASGCAWSLLFTGTPGVYESSGWKVFQRSHVRGRLSRPGGPSPSVRRATLDEWPLLAELYDRHNASRPLSTARSAGDWRRRVPLFYDNAVDLLLDEGSGYVATRWHEESVELLEAAGHLPPLLSAVAAEAARRGITDASARLTPDDPALPYLLEEVRPVLDAAGMARPLAVDPSVTVNAPNAVYWRADDF
ncbi:GNAT family N-acetyltransferase [Nonomuraea sp. NPDC049714]|uniref:GNAT family N-acetyltransferase n=1 Tax=Nonomuraea sp. NPDC049714 TaxID=3364357 RepID=UPI0037B12E81